MIQVTPRYFDWTINVGNVISAVTFVFAGVVAWRDLTWRIKNLEVWRTEHMIDSDARDQIIQRLDKIVDFFDREYFQKRHK